MRKIFALAFWVAVCLSLATVLWALWYVSHRGFTHKWRQRVIEEVEKRGVYLSVGRLTLNPLQGLVARDVRIRTSREKSRAFVASVNEVVLDINYSNLVHGEPFLNAAELHDATLTLPLDSTSTTSSSKKSERLKISRLNARLIFSPHQLALEQAEAWVRGMRVTASGHFVNPEKFQWSRSPSTGSRENPLDSLRQALRTFDNLKLDGGEPTLDLRFSGDLSKPSEIFAEAVFRSGNFSVDNAYRVESVHIAATLADGLVRIDPCTVKDEQGALDASASLRLATGEAELRLRSALDLPDLLRALDLAPALGEIAFYGPPVLDLTGKANFREKRAGSDLPGSPQFFGHLSVGRFAVRSLIFEGAGGGFSWGSGRWYLHDARVRHKQGALSVNAIQGPEGFRFNVDSQVSPNLFLPFLPIEAQTRLSEWEFLAPPKLHLEGHGPRPDPAALEVTGRAQLGATRARGVLLDAVSLDVGFKSNVLTCNNILLTRPEGTGAGTVVYDFNTDELQFHQVKTTLNPVEIVSIFDRELATHLTPYRFKARPALVVDGKVGCRRGDLARNHLRVDVNGASGMDYTFIKKNLSASKITGIVNIFGDRLKLDQLEATLFGGRLHGQADISIRKAAGDYTAQIFTEEIDFPSLTKLYFDYDTSKGKMNSSFVFSGKHDWVRAISGTGQLNVTDGNVFAIPIFGPFSSILDEVLPGSGYNDARKGVCTFEMREGIVSTKDLVMEGKGFSIFGEGKLDVANDKMNFTARINAQGIPGKLLSPVSRILEYVSDGSLSKPIWRPKLLPKIMWFAPRAAPNPPPVGG